MNGRIAQLNYHFQLYGDTARLNGKLAQLKAMAAKPVVHSYAAALDAALDGDTRVYVLRQVNCALTLGLTEHASETELARCIGEGMAAAVMRAITHADEQCVIFSSQADFIAHFVTDLLRGDAHGRWYYGAFARLQHMPTAFAIQTVLIEERDYFPDILNALYQLGMLESLLHALGCEAIAELWERAVRTPTLQTGEAQLFFAQVLALIDTLGLWAQARPDNGTFQAYYASRPAAADWHNRQSLTEAFAYVLHFLSQRGYLRHGSLEPGAALIVQLEQALSAYDWLDSTLLRQTLIDLLAAPQLPATDLPPRSPGTALTPRQQALMEDLHLVLHMHAAELLPEQTEAMANALRLYTWLLAHNPEWAADTLVHTLLGALLDVWHAFIQSGHAAELLVLFQSGQLAAVLAQLPEQSRAEAAGSLQFLLQRGRPAIKLLATLLNSQALPSSPQLPDYMAWPYSEAQAIATSHAGVALILRAVLDLRLPAVLSTTTLLTQLAADMRLRAVLLALMLRWSGASGSGHEQIDPGLRLLAGWQAGDPSTLTALRELLRAPADQYEQFQAACLRILLGQRLVGGRRLFVHGLEQAHGSYAIFAGDESATLWPLATIVRSSVDLHATLQRWSALWIMLVGEQPLFVLGPELNASSPTNIFRTKGPHTDQDNPVHAGNPDEYIVEFVQADAFHAALLETQISETRAVHATSRARLDLALRALDYGQPGDAMAELTITITAIALLRGWCRWMRQFGDSSIAYLLKNFIHRPGRILQQRDGFQIELSALPLDMVLQISGYTSTIERLPWLDGRSLHFLIQS